MKPNMTEEDKRSKILVLFPLTPAARNAGSFSALCRDISLLSQTGQPESADLDRRRNNSNKINTISNKISDSSCRKVVTLPSATKRSRDYTTLSPLTSHPFSFPALSSAAAALTKITHMGRWREYPSLTGTPWILRAGWRTTPRTSTWRSSVP